MAKNVNRKRQVRHAQNNELKTRLIAVFFFFIFIVAFLKLGVVGIYIDIAFRYLFGIFTEMVYGCLAILCLYIIFEAKFPSLNGPKSVGVYLILLAVILYLSAPKDGTTSGFNVIKLFISDHPSIAGGFIGALLFSILSLLFAPMGTKILAVFIGIIGACLIIGKTYFDMMRTKIRKQKEQMQKKIAMQRKNSEKKSSLKPKKTLFFPDKVFEEKKPNFIAQTPLEVAEEEEEIKPVEIIKTEPTPIHMASIHEDEIPFDVDDLEETIEETKQQQIIKEVETSTEDEMNELNFDNNENTLSEYQLPNIDLLNPLQTRNQKKDLIQKVAKEKAERLANVLNEFGVHARVTEIYIGPSVTKYELKLDSGTSVKRINSLQDDMKLALAAKDIRIEAPIPGKSAVGVEIPNAESTTVSFREVLKDVPESKKDSKLLVPLGKDVMGASVFAELDKMPHLLIAGATGSGKSVCVNGIICSLLMRTRPDEVKLMLVDPKKVELSNYNGIPHLISPVITDPKKAAKALRVVVEEMERRYELFANCNVRNIQGYNDYVIYHNNSNNDEPKKEKLPFIVVILDEVADLMMVASKDVEDCIMRISQMARAAGIHLIVATQRPSTDVITGVVKANIPSRIAFAVSSTIDSRTILDMGGAEKLLGKGDMLYSPMGSSAPTRVQGSFVSDEEVQRIVDFVSNQKKAEYNETFVNLEISSSSSSSYDDVDEEYEDCREFVIKVQKASASLLQRQFRIGYNKAARIIDQLEENGVIGPQLGAKPREVLIRGYEEE